MKPNKRTVVPPAPPRAEAGDVESEGWVDRVDGLEGDEGNGGAYGHPRSDEEDEKADRSRERG